MKVVNSNFEKSKEIDEVEVDLVNLTQSRRVNLIKPNFSGPILKHAQINE